MYFSKYCCVFSKTLNLALPRPDQGLAAYPFSKGDVAALCTLGPSFVWVWCCSHQSSHCEPSCSHAPQSPLPWSTIVPWGSRTLHSTANGWMCGAWPQCGMNSCPFPRTIHATICRNLKTLFQGQEFFQTLKVTERCPLDPRWLPTFPSW